MKYRARLRPSLEASGEACAGTCVEPSPGYEKTIRRRGDPKGAFIYRTEGDPKVNLAIQLYDYDVNAYYPSKERHSAALGYVSEFVLKRLAEHKRQPAGDAKRIAELEAQVENLTQAIATGALRNSPALANRRVS